MKTENRSLQRLVHRIAALQRSAHRKDRKDIWDKLGIIGQLTSSVVIASLGILVTIVINRAQGKITKAQMVAADRVAQAQLSTSERRLSADYLDKIMSAKEPGDRGKLINDLDIALLPDNAVPIALRFAYPNNFGPYLVGQSAIHVLERMKVSGRSQLEAASRSGAMPESEIARGLLGEPVQLLLRASDIDDDARLMLNSDTVSALKYGEDSGWLDETSKLVRGKTATIYFEVENGPYGGCGGRLRISAGVQQLDIERYYTDCPPNQKAWYIRYDISVGIDGHMNFILAPEVVMISNPPPSTCTIGCE